MHNQIQLLQVLRVMRMHNKNLHNSISQYYCSPPAVDAHCVNTSVVDWTPSLVGRLATTSLVVRMSVEDGTGRDGRINEL